MQHLKQSPKASLIKLHLNVIFKSLIIIPFLFCNTSLFAQHLDVVFNDLGKGNTHKYWEKYSPNQQLTSNDVLAQLKKDNVLSLSDSLGLILTKTSHEVTHRKLQQFHNGLPVEGAYFSTHSINGFLIAFNGTLVSSLPTYNTNTIITSSDAVGMAIISIDAAKYAWEDEAYIALLQSANEDEDFSIFPTPVLTLYKDKTDRYLLAYKMEINTIKPQGRFTVYIDANTGSLLDKLDNLHHANASVTCATVHHGAQNLNIDLNGSNYELTDKLGASNRNVETYLLPDNSVNYASASIPLMNAASPITDCFSLNTNLSKAALDVHWATGVTYDFFKAIGINSFDNNGSLIRNYTNYGDDNASKNNAFWNGSFLTYGAGGGSPFPGPVVTLDVAAHEFGHAITEEYGGGLLYYGESGAINESISDMIAASVEHNTIANNAVYSSLTTSSDPWIISRLNGGGLRGMSNPNLYNDPDTYNGLNWASTIGPDNGGVHTNSSVGNYWFYLLANPLGSDGNQVNDNGTTYNVNTIGFDDALAIVLESYNYLNYTSDYLDFRNATITAAELLFNDWRVCEVIYAWDAVGVGVPGETCSIQTGITYVQTQFCNAQVMSFSNYFAENPAYTYTWTLNGLTTTGYDLNINAPSTPGVYTLVQTVTDNFSGTYVTAEIDLYINNCTPIDATAHNAHWYFGSQQGFDFSNGIAQMTSFPYRNFEKGTNFSIGNDLKYYVAASQNNDTMNLYDNSNNVLANLSPLFCSSRKLGSSAPDANNEYINLFLSSSNQGGSGLYRLTVQIDGSGNVIYDSFTPVSGPAYVSTDANSAIQTLEAIAVIPGCNSSIFWLIAPKISSNGSGVLVYKLDYTNTTSSFSNFGNLSLVHDYSPSNAVGGVVATSRDGRFIALQARIYEFDRSTGTFTNFAYLGQSGYGCFSSNSRYYYESSYLDGDIYQYDLNASNVSLSKTLVGVLPSYLGLNDLELGPDDKIYISSGSSSHGASDAFIGVVNNPNVKEVNGSTMFNPSAYYFSNGSVNNVCVFPDFTETLTVEDAPLSILYVQENCSSFNFSAPDCLPYYSWDFGDGTVLLNSNLDEISHTFAGTGPYTVSLTSTINGAVTTVTETIDFGIDVNSIEISGTSNTCEINDYYSGPTGFEEYAWSIISGSATINNMTAQQTTVTNNGMDFTLELTVTDYDGCSATVTKSVSVGSPPNIVIVSSNCKTAGNCDGEIQFDISGGLAPYSYTLGTAQSGSSNGQVAIANLCINNYSINVTDANGCETSQFQTLDCGVTLPIELLYFQADMNEDNTASLYWETLTEINNDYFTIERSIDGIDWDFVLEVDGAGNSNELLNYKAIDLKPVNGLTYYRLKQTDFDANYSYSNVFVVNSISKNKEGIVIFPNPTKGLLNITLDVETIEVLQIYSVLGKELSNEISVLSHTGSKLSIDFRHLADGMYFIKINDFSRRVLKKSD